MATYYINADTGNDATGDGSALNPWLTILHAKDNVVDNDTIICQDATATYLFEQLDINHSITIKGESVEGAIFSTVSAQQSGWALTGDNYITLKFITFANIDISHNSSAYVLTAENSGATMDIISCVFRDITITAGGFNWASGIINKLYLYSTYIITGCIFYNIENRGIIVRHAQNEVYTDISFNNCVFNFTTDTHTDILIGQNDPPTSFKNCIIYNDTLNTKFIASYSNGLGANTSFDYNCVYGLFSNPITGTGNLLDTDPLFIDAATNNYNLSPTSPCIDAGTLI